jgi:3-hydroxyisobutyrate dehydrogenase-like beta-hydroxyacid dehydrogenase
VERVVTKSVTVGLLGFGEVGQVLADDLSAVGGVLLRAYDTQFGRDSLPHRAVHARTQIEPAASASDLPRGCDVVISAVTAAEDVAATRSICEGLGAGTYVLDLNSVAPDTRRACAALVDDAGGRYVEAAVMAPIAPRRSRSPMLLGGPHAAAFQPQGKALGFSDTRLFSSEIGPASATKMCRSVIVKGLEAVVTESLLAARHYAVDEAVLESLGDLMAGRDWRAYAHYLIGRSIEHGARRAEEMLEVTSTVSAAGIEPLMSTACATRQAWAARFPLALEQGEVGPLLDAILDEMRRSLAC